MKQLLQTAGHVSIVILTSIDFTAMERTGFY